MPGEGPLFRTFASLFDGLIWKLVDLVMSRLENELIWSISVSFQAIYPQTSLSTNSPISHSPAIAYSLNGLAN
jgi:hypothetical protein